MDDQLQIRDHRHRLRALPRQWTVLPEQVQAQARVTPIVRRLFPSHVGFFPNAQRHEVDRPRGVDSTIFQYCTSGRGWCRLGERSFQIRPGQLLVVPRLAAHAYGSDPRHPWTVHWFHAQGDDLDAVLHELGANRENPVLSIGRHARLIALFDELNRVLEDDYSPAALLYASQLLSHVLGSLIRQARERSEREPSAEQRVQNARRLAKAQLAQHFDVARLAAMAGVSVPYFSATFRKLTGYAPKSYFTRLRLHRAAQLLGTSEQSVAQIAEQLGYQDPLYFSRAFRKINGLCPSEYRERERGARSC